MDVRDLSTVAVAACDGYEHAAVKAALLEVLAPLGGLEAFLQPGQTILVKPNLLSPHPPERAVTTHPSVMRAMIELCEARGAGRIWVGDSPSGMHEESLLYSRTGMTTAVAGTGAELKSWTVRQVPRPCGGDVLPVPAWLSEVDVVISMAKLKTHSLTTMTGALKNVYGLVSGVAKTQFHARYPSPGTMSAFLVRVHAALPPTLTVVDAVTAMEGNGPAIGRPVHVGVLLAGTDAVALDAVACEAFRIAPASVPMIRMAADQGLGTLDPQAIHVVGTGVSRLRGARLKPSLSRLLRYVPESLFGLGTRAFRLRPGIHERLCTACGICVEACPRSAIDDAGKLPVIRQKDCIACFCCMESCPKGAIALQLHLGTLFRIARRLRRPAAGTPS